MEGVFSDHLERPASSFILVAVVIARLRPLFSRYQGRSWCIVVEAGDLLDSRGFSVVKWDGVVRALWGSGHSTLLARQCLCHLGRPYHGSPRSLMTLNLISRTPRVIPGRDSVTSREASDASLEWRGVYATRGKFSTFFRDSLVDPSVYYQLPIIYVFTHFSS